jgi:hypothetical protein
MTSHQEQGPLTRECHRQRDLAGAPDDKAVLCTITGFDDQCLFHPCLFPGRAFADTAALICRSRNREPNGRVSPRDLPGGKPPGGMQGFRSLFIPGLEVMTCPASRVKSALIDLDRSATCVPLRHRNVRLAAHVQFTEMKLAASA